MDDFDHFTSVQQQMLDTIQRQLEGIEVPGEKYILAAFFPSELSVIRQFIKSFHEGEEDE